MGPTVDHYKKDTVYFRSLVKSFFRRAVFFVGILGIMATTPACCPDCEPPYREGADPVYLSYNELRQPIQLGQPGTIIKAGKIWVSGKYLLVNDLNRGIHLFNNTNPALPINLGLILIPGNVDLAVKDSVLFADSFIDLVAIDLQRLPAEIVFLKRMENIFPYNPYQIITDSNIYFTSLDQSKGVVIGYTLKEPVKKKDNIIERIYNLKEQGQEEEEIIAH